MWLPAWRHAEFSQQSGHDVFDDVTRGVIYPAGLADFGFLLDGHTTALRADDLAQKPLINRAKDFDRNIIEQVRRFVVTQIRDEPGQPVIADNQFFAEMRLEKIAVKKWNVRRRAAVRARKCRTMPRQSESFGARMPL